MYTATHTSQYGQRTHLVAVYCHLAGGHFLIYCAFVSCLTEEDKIIGGLFKVSLENVAEYRVGASHLWKHR